MYNIIIYLPTSSMYCCYTTFGNIGCGSKGLTGQSYTWMHKNYVLSLSGCTSIIFINPGTKIDGCYYHDIVLMPHMLSSICSIGVILTYSSKTAHQRIIRSSSFYLKLRNSLLQTYGLQIVLMLTP